MPPMTMTTDQHIHLLLKTFLGFLYELAKLPTPGPCDVRSVEVKALARTADAVFMPRDPHQAMLVVEIQAQKEMTAITASS
jgi:hypothetical protein